MFLIWWSFWAVCSEFFGYLAGEVSQQRQQGLMNSDGTAANLSRLGRIVRVGHGGPPFRERRVPKKRRPAPEMPVRV
jgi:hypothetical protein